MPFLMKMDSFLPNTKNTTARITKNSRFTQTIWTIFRYRALRKQMLTPIRWGCFLPFSRVIPTCWGKPKRSLLYWMLAVFQSRALFLLTRYLSSRFHRIDRRPWENTTRKQSFFLYRLRLRSRSPVFSNSSSRSGVIHRIIFSTFGPKNYVLSILCPTIPYTIAMFTTKATI